MPVVKSDLEIARAAVMEDGKRRRRSTVALVLLRLRNLALDGKNVRVFEEFDRLMKVYQPEETEEDDGRGYLVVPAPVTAEEAIAEGEKANADARARRAAREGDRPS